jgi:hypothetical protein
MRYSIKRPAVAGVSPAVAAGLALAGCGSSSSSRSSVEPTRFSKHAGTAAASGGPANSAVAGWTLPGGNLASTRDVASPISSSNVATLGVAWCVPVESTGSTGAADLANGYATVGFRAMKEMSCHGLSR